MLRPAARMLQLTVALPATAVLVYLAWWWWVPVPLAASFAMYEWFFWSRADKPLRVELADRSVRIADFTRKEHRTVSLESAESATLIFRRVDTDIDAVLAIADARTVFLAVRFRLPADRFEASPADVDADLCNAVLGSISGVIRAVAPAQAIVRQPLGSAEALDWFRAVLPSDVFERTSVRGWVGSAPDLDLFGYHSQPADGLIRLQGSTARYWDGVEGPLEAGIPQVAERSAVLFRMDGEEHSEAPERLPLWVHRIGPRSVAIPAPLAIGRGPDRTLDESLVHVHPPEGAAILWHLWRNIPREQWPAEWLVALREARPTLEATSASATLPPFPRWLDDQAPVRG